MVRQWHAGRGRVAMVRQRHAAKPASARRRDDGLGGDPPAPFKRPPEVLLPLVDTLDSRRVYIAHVDAQPASHKRSVFVTACAGQAVVALLLLLRVWWVLPWYLRLLASALGYANETTTRVDEMAWREIAPEVARRALTFVLDLALAVYAWPGPYAFAFGRNGGRGNAVSWRWVLGFRAREVVVRRSRGRWAEQGGGGGGGGGGGDVVRDETARSLFVARVAHATSPALLAGKTGMLLADADWELDWAAMLDAHTMVDEKMAAVEAFTLVVLRHHADWGWLCVDMKQEAAGQEDHRRRRVLAFRDALVALGKEDLFYRWIEIVQFESSQPGGFGPEKQEATALQIRDMFQQQGVDFDQLWKDSVGTDSSLGI
ncbi:hypothetical protein GGR56DRAFT_694285 [Xylariaceae sp. FL0804]|nr:hypothetical protein GGR56DRAFT_694285 [Xylariaceae sp. FL0804]